MPVTQDKSPLRLRGAHGFVDRIFRRVRPTRETPPPAHVGLVDANTRTFWARGAAAPATLVEAGAAHDPVRGVRVKALVSAHDHGHLRVDGRPRANPAFTEALFVELMRAHQYPRAFAMLWKDCRAAWGSPEKFAAAQGAAPMHRLRGVRVLDVRHLGQWTDPERGTTHRDVAELEVEYTVGAGRSTTTLQRIVHLVSAEGRWWSLCYPG
jgi:hypothetical protein